MTTERLMYQAVCADCKIGLEVPFKPDGIRPVYCKEHLAQRQRRASRAALRVSQRVDLLEVDTVFIKFFFSEKEKIPSQIPHRQRKRTSRGLPVKSKNIDEGILHFDTQETGARFLEQDLLEAEEGQWRPVSIQWWSQTSRTSKKRQYVVQVAWKNQPGPERELKFTPEQRDKLRELVSRYSWTVRIWSNPDNRPATINFTSPKPVSETPQRLQVLIEDDYITVE